MSFANSLFSRDIARLAQSADAPKLIGRPSTNPDVLAENEFIIKHGMTRLQADEMRLAHQQQCAEEEAVRDLSGKPPNLVNTKGLGERRASYANFLELLHVESRRRDDLLQRRAELEVTIAAPDATQERITTAVKQTAAAMMGRVPVSEKIDRGALDAQLSSERHQAEAAHIAMIEIEKQIETAELRCDHLNSRESEFLNPALVEAADEIGLGKAYMRKIGELRVIMDLMNGLASVAGDFGSGFGRPQAVNFTKVGLPSLAKTESTDYTIPAAGNSDVWRQLARALKMNPRMDASKFVAVPKG